ncbi:YaaC family protein [Metabacillus sp. 84]|uniref:YaaC family protein n=1 Tax=unclassified Metabacillus TaxID=2675274 RepID=UPI003CF1DCAC
MTPWKPYILFYSTESTQKFLEKIYKKHGAEAALLSYRNSCPFTYYLMHAESFYRQAEAAPFSIRPILLFYGLSQLIKACLLTEDPHYPETTSVLAHGVTARKKKKQDYSFLKDEVRVQKNGLFHHTARTLFHLREMDRDRYTMEMLLRRIPEMESCFTFLRNGKAPIPLKQDLHAIIVPPEAATAYHITDRRLAEIIEHHTGLSAEEKNGEFRIDTQDTLTPFASSLFSYHCGKKEYSLPAEKQQLFILPELLTHYLVSYNLSMISRYETEWWYDLIQNRASSDYIYISSFMEITGEKIPRLVWDYLSGRALG